MDILINHYGSQHFPRFTLSVLIIFPKINSYPPEQYQICADIYSLNKDTINEQNRKHVT